MSEKWHFEHDDLDCPKCKTEEGSFSLDFYIGEHNGRDAHKYQCTNEDCGYEKIEYIDEMKVDEDGNIEKVKNSPVGTKITLANGQTRILKEDKKGLYVIMGGLRSYVYYMENYGKWATTGEWQHEK